MESKSPIHYLAAVPLFVGLLAICWYAHIQYHVWILRVQARAHAVGEERGDLSHLLSAVEYWLVEDPRALDGFKPSGTTVCGSNLLKIVKASKHGDSLMELFGNDHSMADRWGNPIQFKFSKVGTTNAFWVVTIWSFGPNGVNELGAGDDLVTCAPVGR
jgi:hypothetical protein